MYRPCVYRYIDMNDNEIKYVGIVYSGTLYNRIYQHRKDEWFDKGNWKVEYFYVNTRSEAEAMESHLISLYRTDLYFNIAKTGWGINQYLPDVSDKWIEFVETKYDNSQKTKSISIKTYGCYDFLEQFRQAVEKCINGSNLKFAFFIDKCNNSQTEYSLWDINTYLEWYLDGKYNDYFELVRNGIFPKTINEHLNCYTIKNNYIYLYDLSLEHYKLFSSNERDLLHSNIKFICNDFDLEWVIDKDGSHFSEGTKFPMLDYNCVAKWYNGTKYNGALHYGKLLDEEGLFRRYNYSNYWNRDVHITNLAYIIPFTANKDINKMVG